MFSKRFWAVIALCVLAVFSVGIFAEASYAQDSGKTKGMDKNIATKKGVGDSLGGANSLSDAPGASRKEAAIAIGSTVVMIVVVKWL